MSERKRYIRQLAITTMCALGLSHTSVASAQGVFISVRYDSLESDSLAQVYMATPNSSLQSSQCTNALSRESMTTVATFLRAGTADTASSIALQADLMAQDVANELDTLIKTMKAEGIPDSSMPTWRSVPSQLVVVAHADGSITRRGVSPNGDRGATALLEKAFDAARAHEHARIIWPDGYAAQSLVVHLALEPGSPTVDGPVARFASTRPRFAAFALPYPTESPALPREGNRVPRYPQSAEMRRVTAYVLLQFVVDTLGRAVPSTVHDLWPASKPRLTGELGQYYQDFVHSVEQALPSWKFYPARIGSCPVRQIVQLPVAFEVPRP